MWVLLLVLAWFVALIACGRLCLAAVAASRLPEPPSSVRDGSELALRETAFLAGGPTRVVDVTLVRMARERRLLLAHTGWVTVAAPEARDDIEGAVLDAIGPDGQARIPLVRTAAAADEAMAALDDRLSAMGLAVPRATREAVRGGIRQVRKAGVAVVLLALTAGALHPAGTGSSLLWGWFSLPLVLVTGCLVVAWIEVHPYTQWASIPGQQLLARMGIPRPRRGGLAEDPDSPADEAALLTAVAVRGPAALPEAGMRAALAPTMRK
ncbi:TIGR04222 domain-containing membrane protein [Streptomyces sp. A7024]|uniref:TIGR04222 domain-containing membrane protein n=1 Tax=Streptomyces coryli TaxID=1128680 RepID=A0A6G4U860_9ACTN|nr:TIGR04222 domain-containing membrane protein [Streptomyces coryli]NGN67896.1 TIGR04222 domain-containing membrane protein [Streptomyces coryli]